MKSFKRPSKIKFTFVGFDKARPKTIGECTFGDTIMFRESPHMVVEVSAWHATKHLPNVDQVKAALKDAPFVLNMATGRVYVITNEEVDEEAVFIDVKAEVTTK